MAPFCNALAMVPLGVPAVRAKELPAERASEIEATKVARAIEAILEVLTHTPLMQGIVLESMGRI